MFRSTIAAGAVTAFVLIIISILEYQKLVENQTILNIACMLVLFAGIVLGIKNYRDKSLNGYISYGTGLGAGTIISLQVGILVAISVIIYMTINPEYVGDLREQSLQEAYADQDMNDEQLEMMNKVFNIMFSPAVMGVLQLLFYVFIGFVFSLIISIFMKKPEPYTP